MEAYSYVSKHNPDDDIQFMSIDQITKRLCGKSRGDICVCVDCSARCIYGERAVELLENQTKGTKLLNKREQHNASLKVNTMKTYLKVLTAEDPVQYLINELGYETDQKARTKLSQWKHVYGYNPGMISNKIKEIENEIAESRKETDKTSTMKQAVIESINTKISEEKKHTRRQEEKISQSYLETKRKELEEEILKSDDDIKKYEAEIEKCKANIEEATNQIQAIRKVLEIFKKKDAQYV